MSAIEQLNEIARRSRQFRYQSVPQHAFVSLKYKDDTANGLTKCVIDFLRFQGCQAERISVEGRVIDTRKKYVDGIGRVRVVGNVTRVRSSGQKGSADISAIVAGRSLKIEVKIGKDRQSVKQGEYQKSVENAGGIYLIVRNFQEFYDWYLMIKR